MSNGFKYTPVLTSDEGKSIINQVNALTTWDRRDLVSKLALDNLDIEWVKENFEYGTVVHSYGAGEDSDPIAEVFDQCRQKDVLEEMDDDDIVEVLLRKNMIPDILSDLTDEQLTKVLKGLSKPNQKRIIDTILKLSLK